MNAKVPQDSQTGPKRFWGSPEADLFTLEIAASFQGVLTRNMITDPTDPMVGFVSASIDGRPWTDTMWTRDAGVFLRELVLWGDLEHACLVAGCLMALVQGNDEGYTTFPMYFQRGQTGSGSELDGTCAIVIGFVLLWELRAETHPMRVKITDFLNGPASPLAYILHRLERHPLIPGSGEFGGGLGIEGDFYNVVQNHLVRLALLLAARMARWMGHLAQAEVYSTAAEKISEGMLRYLCGADGGWLWAIDAGRLQPDPAVIDNIYNKGAGGLNGVLSMWPDGLGLTPLESNWAGIEPCLKTFSGLLNTPKRQAMFEKYGIWTQFDDLWEGYMTSPSYGHSYATQAMLLTDKLEMAGKAVDFLARMTYQPFPGNKLDRESPYYFYEPCYLPELMEAWLSQDNQRGKQPEWIANGFDGQNFDQGCGALNLVNVAEPLKIARLILGVDDSNPAEVRLIPRLPPTWQGMEAENWPILTSKGLIHASIRCERSAGNIHLVIKVIHGEAIPALAVRLFSAKGYTWKRAENVFALEEYNS